MEGLRVMTTDEAAWVERAKAGDKAAFEAIFQRYERQIYSFIYRMMGDADDAYDLTQDCFVKAYRALSGTSDDLNVSAWLHRIASNACLDVLRRRQRLRWLPWEGPKHDHLLVSAPGRRSGAGRHQPGDARDRPARRSTGCRTAIGSR